MFSCNVLFIFSKVFLKCYKNSEVISFEGELAYARVSRNPEQDTPILQFKNSAMSRFLQPDYIKFELSL